MLYFLFGMVAVGTVLETCGIEQHEVGNYTFEETEQTYIETNESIKEKYGKAKDGMSNAQHVFAELEKEILKEQTQVLALVSKVTSCNNELKKSALSYKPLAEKEYIELMIQEEKSNRMEGFIQRIGALESIKKRC